MTISYWNGHYLPLDEVQVSPLDRGFLFADGLYEVTAAYNGHLFEPEAHVARLQRGMAALRIDCALSAADWMGIMERLAADSGIDGDLTVYLQVTRGAAASRGHAFPAGVTPSVFGMVSPLKRPPAAWRDQGVSAITIPDIRWGRCDLKTIALLGSVLAQQAATDAGVVDALQLRDGLVTEGAATNIFVVKDGVIATPLNDPRILEGITRTVILRLVAENGLRLEERDIPAAELDAADEIWIASTTKEITPVTNLNGKPVGTGAPGMVWRRMFALFAERLGR
ncbi:D-alanine aminotransferase [Azospirillum thiophilum]|uniref:Probable branched-chain-amino-acid aminotransferase n=1 Tax=Azospirillum thiophilum TaxID=528244 RepID=A0AAC8W0J8_9PROT|nr:D-amino acid aminotransferase [Azospirillum thiophilum]ALG72868.1 D-alanine aminotransferase [Azospirillum thiophilum]KJR64216.1 D-alanine aminotransferase [Azospirillum thiophilum]